MVFGDEDATCRAILIKLNKTYVAEVADANVLTLQLKFHSVQFNSLLMINRNCWVGIGGLGSVNTSSFLSFDPFLGT